MNDSDEISFAPKTSDARSLYFCPVTESGKHLSYDDPAGYCRHCGERIVSESKGLS